MPGWQAAAGSWQSVAGCQLLIALRSIVLSEFDWLG